MEHILSRNGNQLNMTALLSIISTFSTVELEKFEEKLGSSFDSFIKNFLNSSHVGNISNDLLMPDWDKPQINPETYYLHRTTRYLLLYLPPVLLLAGTAGNILSAVVLNTREMSKHPTSSYLIALSVADTAVLYFGLFRFWIVKVFHLKYIDSSDEICKFINFVSTTASNLSAWLLVAVTIDRYLGICQPLKAQTRGVTGRTPKTVILSIFLVFFLINLHFFWTVSSRLIKNKEEIGMFEKHFNNGDLLEFKEPSRRCGLNENFWASKVWPWIDMILYSFVPFTLLLTFNSFIVRAITLSKRFVRSSSLTLQSHLSVTKTGSCSSKSKEIDPKERANHHRTILSQQSNPSLFPIGKISPENLTEERRTANLNISNGESKRLKIDSSTRISFMLLIVSFSYVVLTLPMNLVMIAAAFINDMADSLEGEVSNIEASFGLARIISEMLMYTNHAINFYLYCLTGSVFRRNFMKCIEQVITSSYLRCLHKKRSRYDRSWMMKIYRCKSDESSTNEAHDMNIL